MSEFIERAKARVAHAWQVIWPVPLLTALVSASLGAGAVRLFMQAIDIDERMRKVALERVMQDVRDSKGFAEKAGRDFQERLNEYHAKRRKRDAIVLNSALSSLEKVSKVQALEPGLIDAERAIYRDPLAAAANKRTLFLEFVINKPAAFAPANPGLAQAEAQP